MHPEHAMELTRRRVQDALDGAAAARFTARRNDPVTEPTIPPVCTPPPRRLRAGLAALWVRFAGDRGRHP